VNPGIPSMRDGKEEKSRSAEDQQQCELRAEVSPKPQSTTPKVNGIKRANHLDETDLKKISFLFEMKTLAPARKLSGYHWIRPNNPATSRPGFGGPKKVAFSLTAPLSFSCRPAFCAQF
jgi:hypothetical protein